ncbi:MAG: CAP domain-containing protein [Alphaproteobacteria bacterium]|nr:CAP domain-containing protein [Alphaproteobacteria bacterium]
MTPRSLSLRALVLVTTFVATGACDLDEPAVGTAAAQAPPPLVLTVPPLLPGQPATFSVDGAIANALVVVARGTAAGSGPCPPELHGGCLGVTQPLLLGAARADATGFAAITVDVPTTVPVGLPSVFQAAASLNGAGATSAVVTAPIADPIDLCDPTGAGVYPGTRAALECELLAEVNQARAVARSCGTKGTFAAVWPLTMHPSLQQAARVHSAWQADTGSFGHASPGGPLGDTMPARATNAGYTPWVRLREDIGWGQNSPAQAVRSWLRSDGHCANLMAGDVRDIGLGVAVDPNGDPYWTALFGRLQ